MSMHNTKTNVYVLHMTSNQYKFMYDSGIGISSYIDYGIMTKNSLREVFIKYTKRRAKSINWSPV